jgi:hypothetical protein
MAHAQQSLALDAADRIAGEIFHDAQVNLARAAQEERP